jgi:hypothetical protein
MQHPPFPRFDVTPEGLTLDGKLLAKRKPDGTFALHEAQLSKALPPLYGNDAVTSRALRYANCAGEWMAQVTDADWDNRTPHPMDKVPALVQVRMLLALALPVPFHKYSPGQPRVPAGNSDGGQWTSEGGGQQVADSGQIMTDANAGSSDGTKSKLVSYSDGTPVIDPNTGKPYPMPEGMDIAANVKAAEDYDPDATDADRAASMMYWFSQGGSQDYQRPDGYFSALLFGDYVKSYRNVTNYNYGAVAAAMGYSLDDALTAAGLYNQMRGRTNEDGMNVVYGIQNIAINNITQGFKDYLNGKWTARNK